MEFWGVEVKKGQPLKVTPGLGSVLHLSQACLGEQKKEKKESVNLFVEIDEKKLVLATLSTEKLPQQQFDLVFDRDFELTHNWKNGSVYFYGYKAPFGDDPPPGSEFDSSESDESESEEEEIPLAVANNGKAKDKKPVQAETSNAGQKKESGSGKQKVQIVEPIKDEESESEEDSGEDSDEDKSDEGDTEDEEDDEDSDDSEEETPKKAAVPSKKRPAESTSKTPAADKKAKVTPQKTDGKKANVHVATPHPAKQAKTPANKPNQQTPKSGGTHTCTSCNKAFGSDKALESHSKAKHAAN